MDTRCAPALVMRGGGSSRAPSQPAPRGEQAGHSAPTAPRGVTPAAQCSITHRDSPHSTLRGGASGDLAHREADVGVLSTFRAGGAEL